VDGPIERRPGLRGTLVYGVKRVLRKLMSWYVGPFAADQRNFNQAVLRLVDELDARVREVERLDLEARLLEVERGVAGLEPALGRIAELERRLPEELAAADRALRAVAENVESRSRLLGELEERLLRVERRTRAQPAPQAPAAALSPPGGAVPDYFAFEARMRGSMADVRDKQRGYVDDFRDSGPVLDIGCGRGEFLQLLREAGIEARGIDTDADMVAFCRGEGLDVDERDGVSYLSELEDGALGGIFCAHVLEHLPPPELAQLLELARAKLRPGGLFAAETPNPRTLISLSTFFSDLTHAHPLHPETLAYLARQAGFGGVEIRYLNTPDEGRLRDVPLPDGEGLDEARGVLKANIERLNEVIFGPQDFAVLARA
jgi:O-antigen chain-terminating methyltransferase